VKCNLCGSELAFNLGDCQGDIVKWIKCPCCANEIRTHYNNFLGMPTLVSEVSVNKYAGNEGCCTDIDNEELFIKDLDIKDITLISIEEAEKIPQVYREFYDWWWLKSNGSNGYQTANVSSDGSIYTYGDSIIYNRDYVRPALIVNNLESFNLPTCSKLVINNIEWIKISDNMLLCDDNSFGRHKFDEKSNDYETSEIKKYIHEKAKEVGILK